MPHVAVHALPPLAGEGFTVGLTSGRLLVVRQQFDVQSVTYDWVHTLLQHGVMNTEIERLLSRSSPLGVDRASIQHFLQDEAWVFHAATSSKQKYLHRIFDEHRVSEKSPHKVRRTCSELLGCTVS